MKLFDRHNAEADTTAANRETPAAESGNTLESSATVATDETPVEGTKRAHRWRRRFYIVLGVIGLLLIAGFWLRYLNPYVSDATELGYLTQVEKRGVVFKTWEGEMILMRSLTDTDHVYQREFSFSVDNDALARQLQEYQNTGQLVRVEYRRYLATLPWRGASTFVVTGVAEVETPAEAQTGLAEGEAADAAE